MTWTALSIDEGLDLCTWAQSYSPFMPELQEDPNPYFDRLRAECPVAHSDQLGGFWVLSRYEDVHFALQRHDLFSTTRGVGFSAETFTRLGPDLPLQVDPPEHGKYRTILNPLLSPAVMAARESIIRDFAGRLLDPVVTRQRCDFLQDFAIPFPSEIFVDLMGLPKSELETFLAWKDEIIRADTPEKVRRAYGTVKLELEEYFTAIYEERRSSDDPGDDLMGGMLKARYDGERPLDLAEFVGTACLVWGAGLDTVTAQLSLAIEHLARHPDQRDMLVRDPGLIPAAIEELIRFFGLVNSCRVATQDVELGGAQIKAGDRVQVLFGAAGRDPEQFPEPYELDFTRQPNRHFGFGAGAHRCVGSHLARLELRVAMEEIHRRIPNYRLDPSMPVVHHFGMVRGIDSLHLLID